VEANVSITDTNWTDVTNLVATATSSSYCFPKTTPYHFFQILQVAGATNQPPPTTGTIITPELNISTNGVCLSWPSQVGTNYIVEAKVSITETNWTDVTNLVATAKSSSYCFPKTTPYRFFQILEVAGATNQPPPTTGAVINPDLNITTNRLCLSWSSAVGANYVLEGKRTVVDATWTNLSGTISATNTVTTFCLARPTPYHFFQVLTITGGTGGTNSTSGSTNQISLHTPLVLLNGRLQLTFDSAPGAKYELDVTTNLVPVIHWNTVTNVTATGPTVTLVDPSSITNGPLRFYRVVRP
jgi:hypothetical protein